MNESTQEVPASLFEDWASLAKDDPEAFEIKRKHFINEYIESMPVESRQRMHQLQWRIDTVRRLSKTPMAACLKIYNMMWESAVGDNGMVNKINNLIVAPEEESQPVKTADIVAFRANKHD